MDEFGNVVELIDYMPAEEFALPPPPPPPPLEMHGSLTAAKSHTMTQHLVMTFGDESDVWTEDTLGYIQ